MSENWTWNCLDEAGAPVAEVDVPSEGFGSQAEAEEWLSQSWADLDAAGVTAVVLRRGDEEVYGPMPLAEG